MGFCTFMQKFKMASKKVAKQFFAKTPGADFGDLSPDLDLNLGLWS